VNGASLADPTPKGSFPQKTGPVYWNRLFHQKADGTFEDLTEKAGLQGVGYGMGVAIGDYDNDGYEDLYVTALGDNKLYHNNGNGTFTDVTEKAGVVGGGWSTSAAWVDVDNDGLLDLVVLRYVQWDFDDIWCGEHKEGLRSYCHPDIFQPIAPLVFHNDGNGHFTEVSQKVGISKPGKGLGIAIADYDRDGKIDLFVANDSMIEFLYHNKGEGTFEEVGLVSQVAVDGDGRTYAGMGGTSRTTIMTVGRTCSSPTWPINAMRYIKTTLIPASRIPASAAVSAASLCSIPVGARDSSITTTMAGRTSSSPKVTISTRWKSTTPTCITASRCCCSAILATLHRRLYRFWRGLSATVARPWSGHRRYR
jgi:hypothetical protein